MVFDLAVAPISMLRELVNNLVRSRDRIIAALDLLFTGI
jgi:hypothetical protein